MNSRLHHRLRHHGHCTRAGPRESQSQTPPEPARPLLFVLPTCHPQPPTHEQPASRSRFPSLDLPYPRNVPLPNQWRPSVQQNPLSLAFIPSSRWSAPVEPALTDSQQVAFLCSEWSALVEPKFLSGDQWRPSVEQTVPTSVQLTTLNRRQWRHSLQQAPAEQSVLACSQWTPTALPQTTPSRSQPYFSVEQTPLEQTALTVAQWRPSDEQAPPTETAPTGSQWPLVKDPKSQWRPSIQQANLSRTAPPENQNRPSTAKDLSTQTSLSSSPWSPSVEQAPLEQNALSNSPWRPPVEAALEQSAPSNSQWRPSLTQPPVEQNAIPSCTQKDQLPDTLALLKVPQSYVSTFKISTSPTSPRERPPLVIFPPRQTSPSKIRWADGGDKSEDFSDLEGQIQPVSSALSSSVSSVSYECSRSRDTSVDGYSDISRTGGYNVVEGFGQDISGKYRPCPSCRLGNTCGLQSTDVLQSRSVPCISERCPSEHLSSSRSSCNVPVELLLRRDSPRRAEPLALLVRIHSNQNEKVEPCDEESPPIPALETELNPPLPEAVQENPVPNAVPPSKTEPEATRPKKKRPKRTSDCRNALHFIYVMLHASAIAFRVWDYTARSEHGKPLTNAMPAAFNEKSPATSQEKPPATTPGSSFLGSTDEAQWFERMRARLPDGWVAVRVPDDEREEEFLRRLFLIKDKHKKNSHRRRTTKPAPSEVVEKRGPHRSHKDKTKKHHHKHLGITNTGNSTNVSTAPTGHPVNTSLKPKTKNSLWQDEQFVQRLKDHLENLRHKEKTTLIEGTTTPFAPVRNNKSATLKPVDENILLEDEEAQVPGPRTITSRPDFPSHQLYPAAPVPNKTKKKMPTINKEKLSPVGNIPEKVNSPTKLNPKRPEPYGNVLSKPKFYHKSFVPKDKIKGNRFPSGENGRDLNDTVLTITDPSLSEERPLPKRNNMLGVPKKRDSSVIPDSLINDARNEDTVSENPLKIQESTTEAQKKAEALPHFVTILLDLLVFTQAGSASVFVLILHAALTGYVVCIVPFLIFNILWCFPVGVVLLVYSVEYFLSLAIILFSLAALQSCEIGCLMDRKMERSRKRTSHHHEKD